MAAMAIAVTVWATIGVTPYRRARVTIGVGKLEQSRPNPVERNETR